MPFIARLASRLPACARPANSLASGLPQALAACTAALLALAPAAAAPISHVRVVQTDATGRPNGPVYFETVRLPAQVVPLFLAAGPAPAQNAPFINAGAGTQASVWLDLSPGLHTFTLVGNQGTRNMTHASLTLAFGSAPQTPRIGVLAPFWTDQPGAPAFAVNPVLGGSLSFDDGQRRYELIDFFFASGSRYAGLDRVSDFGVGADGARDAIGQFTLRVTAVPEPGTLPMMLAGGALAGLLWRRRAVHGRQCPAGPLPAPSTSR